MILRSITVQNFRNIELAQLEFDGLRHFFHGANGQGKTNLLECLGYLTALRSFRTADNRLLVRDGEREAAVAYRLEHETFGPTRIDLRISADGSRTVQWEEDRVGRLADLIGRFPSVVFSSGDLLLVRGTPGLRRRWMDLHLSVTVPEYFPALQKYHRALAARNALLKRRASSEQMSAFEREMEAPAALLVEARTREISLLDRLLRDHYRILSGDRETAALRYRPSVPGEAAPGDLGPVWRQSRERDMRLGATQAGPHRDDLEFNLDDRQAARYGSEGQQRSLVVASRLAQARHSRDATGLTPLILLDDVTGELDAGRRERFWTLMEGDAQVFATGVAPPERGAGDWNSRQVVSGTFAPEPDPTRAPEG